MRRTLLPLAVATTLVTGTLAVTTSPADAAWIGPRPAMSAAAFLDTVGVNIHAYYDDTAYRDGGRLVDLVTDLGVRHVRDGLGSGRADQVDVLNALAARGVRSNLIVGGESPTAPGTPDPAAATQLAGVLSGAVASLEAPNEFDCSGRPDWAIRLRTYVQGLAAMAAALGKPLYGPSFCRTGSDAEYGTIGPSSEVLNMHAYPMGQAPELAIEASLPLGRAAAGAHRAVVTESGYHNALHATSGQRPVTEADAAVLLPRLLLDNARVGVERTYLYELMDEKPDPGLVDPEQHFGLVRQDGSVKPGYTAVRNLLRSISRGAPHLVPAPLMPPAPLRYRVQGGGAALRQVLIADPSGRGHTLALWLADPRPEASDPRQAATVRLQLAAARTATSSRPSTGAEAVLGSSRAFDLQVDQQVTLIHLSPSATVAGQVGGALLQPTTPAALERADGALPTVSLDPAVTPWAGATTERAVPAGVAPGAKVTGPGQVARVQVPEAPSTWTVELWAKSGTDAASGAGFFHVAGAPGAQIRTYDMASHPIDHVQISAFGLPNGAGYGQETHAQALPGTWHHLAMTNDGTTVRLYVDGVPAREVPGAPFPLTALELGALSPGWRGSLADLAVYPRALPADRVFAHATASPITCPCP